MDVNHKTHRFILSWDEYFMGVAMMSRGCASKDPNSQVGACNCEMRIIKSCPWL